MAGEERIDPNLSLLLDVLRFSAAMVVLFGHASGKWLTGGYLWQLGVPTRGAVIVFFVLSGYVIAATLRPKAAPAHYIAARLSRLLSVIVPALVVTLLADTIGMHANPDFYRVAERLTHGEVEAHSDPLLRYLTSLFMVNGYWTVPGGACPGTNNPFWSLAYEAAYYVAFGILVFVRGLALRVLLIVGLFLAAGPKILALWPAWLLGVAIWRLRDRLDPRLALPCAIAGVGGLASFYALVPLRARLDLLIPPALGVQLVSDYWAALSVAAFILGMSLLSRQWREMNDWAARKIRTVADHTFELYLLHFPVLYAAVAVTPFAVGSITNLVYVYAVIGIVVATAARFTSPLKRAIRQHVEAWLK